MRVSLLWHNFMYARVLISTPISSNNASSPSPHTILRKYILSCFFQLAAMRQTGCLSSGRTKVVCCYGWLNFLRGLRFPRLVLRKISPSRSHMITLNVHSFIHCLMKHFSCNWVNLINSFIPWLILISFDLKNKSIIILYSNFVFNRCYFFYYDENVFSGNCETVLSYKFWLFVHK